MTEHEPKGGWPCDRREAHGPHPATWTQRAHEGTAATTTETGDYDCPGVQAHPNTSIGGRHDGQPAMYGQIDVGHLTGGN